MWATPHYCLRQLGEIRQRSDKAAWRKLGLIDSFRKKLIEGMQANGYDGQFAERVYRQIRGFGEYGFPESHAASFALLVYVSAWLKCYHPAAFAAALLNSQPMGFYAPAQLVRDARNHGIEVRPVDVNFSHWDCTLEEVETQKQEVAAPQLAIRLGFRMIGSFSQRHAEQIIEARQNGPFRSFGDFTRRCRLSSAVLKQLARADTFGLTQRNPPLGAVASPAGTETMTIAAVRFGRLQRTDARGAKGNRGPFQVRQGGSRFILAVVGDPDAPSRVSIGTLTVAATTMYVSLNRPRPMTCPLSTTAHRDCILCLVHSEFAGGWPPTLPGIFHGRPYWSPLACPFVLRKTVRTRG